MSQSPTNVVQVKPAANVYTVLILIALIGLIVSIGVVGQRLMSDTNGYGMKMGEMFSPPAETDVDSGSVGQ